MTMHQSGGQFDASKHPRNANGEFRTTERTEDLGVDLMDLDEAAAALPEPTHGGYVEDQYAWDDVRDCKANGDHNTSCDDDGYCNLCGEQQMYREDCVASGYHLQDMNGNKCDSCGEAPDGADVAAGRWDAADAHAEAEAEASYAEAAERGDWGQVTVAEGGRTPWGKAQHVENVADGVVFAGTAGHGGFKLSRERNAAIPHAFRNDSGWYEEDLERQIVEFFHPDTITPAGIDEWSTPEQIEAARAEASDAAGRLLMDYMPDEWEKATGDTLTEHESRKRGEEAAHFWAQATDSYVTKSAIGDPAPRGSAPEDRTVSVTVENANTGERLIVTVPENDYHRDRNDYGRFVGPWMVSSRQLEAGQYPSRPDTAHQAAQAANEAKLAAPRHHGPSKHDYLYATRADGTPSPYTPAQRKAIAKDLAQAWRNGDGQVETLGEILATRGVATKSVSVVNGKRQYSLREPAGDGGSFYDYPVSKATWETVDAPDERTDSDKLRQEVQYQRAAAEKAAKEANLDFRNDSKRAAYRAAQERFKDAQAALEAHEQQNGLGA